MNFWYVLGVIVGCVFMAAFEWIVVCGIFALICLLIPELTFSWGIATAVWLGLTLIGMFCGKGKIKVRGDNDE